MAGKIGVGIIGIGTEPRAWATVAHLPALRELSETYEIVAVGTTRQESADAAARHFGVPHAFASAEALVACPGVDLVAVTVKVTQHAAPARVALAAGKHVYCEWPLGKDLAEARQMAAEAKAAGTVAVCGTQARFSPALIHAKQLIQGGYVGEVQSISVIGDGLAWGPFTNTIGAYNNDIANGATMLSIPVGHTMEGIVSVLGEVTDIGAALTNRRSYSTNFENGERVPLSAHDQVLFHGRIGGAPLSVHYRGGHPRGTGLLIEINGSAGDLQILGPNGHAQMSDLELRGATGDAKEMAPIEIPDACFGGLSRSATPGNVARLYQALARHIRTGESDCPTFADAVKRHQMLAAIEESNRADRTVQSVDC